MVAAGVYLLLRIDFLFTEQGLALIALLGAVMGLYAGFCALVQKDIKKILAYSTLSQLGYMAAAFGIGALVWPCFTLPPTLFQSFDVLGSGSVIHACHHEQNIFQYGGLRRRMPLLPLPFWWVLAISGVNFLSGYFSKDAILLWAYNFNLPVFVLLYAGAILTAVYMFRLYFITFEGQSRSDSSSHAKENSLLMTSPLFVLAGFSILGGYFSLYPARLGTFLSSDLSVVASLPSHMWMVVLGTAAWIIGLVFASYLLRYSQGT